MISFLLSVRQSIRYILITSYICCIAALSLLPPRDLPNVQLFEGADKVIHFMMYFIFSVLGCWTRKTGLNPSGIWLILPLTIGWGIFMEIMQLEMHLGRSFEWYDILANSVGSLAGIVSYQLIVNNHARRN